MAAKECTVSQAAAVLLTQTNDRSISYGGWNPNLRSLLRAADNTTLMFGTNVMDTDGTNLKAVLNKRASPTSAWSAALEVAHIVPRINQKDAFIVVGDFVYTYAVNFGSVALEECRFSSVGGACAHVVVSGAVWKPPPNSNYIGASVCCRGTGRVIWFTTVGLNGAPGTWTYLANYGGGWNGPFVFSLNGIGFNDFAYVATSFSPDGRMHFVGQGIVGAYANCAGSCFRAAVGELDLTKGAQGVSMTMLGDASAGQHIMTRSDLWVSAHGDVHVFVTRLLPQYEIAYYMKPATSSSWGAHAMSQRSLLPAGTVGVRIAAAGDTLCLHTEHASGAKSYCFYIPDLSAGQTLDFASSCNHTSVLAAPFANPCAIWTESASHQSVTPLSLSFAVCGQAAAMTDNNVGLVDFNVTWAERTTTTTTSVSATTSSSTSSSISISTAAVEPTTNGARGDSDTIAASQPTEPSQTQDVSCSYATELSMLSVVVAFSLRC